MGSGCSGNNGKVSEERLALMIDGDLSGEAELAALPDEGWRRVITKMQTKGLDGIDLHTKFFYHGAVRAHKSWVKLDNIPDVPEFRNKEVLTKFDFGYSGLAVPDEDEDWKGMSFLEKWSRRASEKLSCNDDPTWFDSNAEGLALVGLTFSQYLPPAAVVWPDFTYDSTMEMIAFNGLGQLFLTEAESGALGKPDGASFVIDFMSMAPYAPREGYDKYGATAFFSAEKRLMGIYLATSGKTHVPGEGAQWEHAKFAWRACMFILTTAREHLMWTHWLIANGLVTSSRENLSSDHPLRRFVKPFSFRTAAINYKSTTSLQPEYGILHRASGLTYSSLVEINKAVAAQFKYEPFPDWLASKKLPDTVYNDLAIVQDGIPYWNIVKQFAASYVDIYWADDSKISADAELAAFWAGVERIRASGYGLPALTKAALVDYLTHTIFWVTGMHEWVGNITEYATVPNGCAGKIRPQAATQDKQAFIQMMVIASLTGLRQPPLYSNWKHCFLQDDKQESVFALVDSFFASCKQLDADIEARNAKRIIPFYAFSPKMMELSVSI